MKKVEKIMNTICLITTAVYFITAILIILGQAGALIALNGEMCVSILNVMKIPAGYAAAATAILCLILGYIRGDMTPEKD